MREADLRRRPDVRGPSAGRHLRRGRTARLPQLRSPPRRLRGEPDVHLRPLGASSRWRLVRTVVVHGRRPGPRDRRLHRNLSARAGRTGSPKGRGRQAFLRRTCRRSCRCFRPTTSLRSCFLRSCFLRSCFLRSCARRATSRRSTSHRSTSRPKKKRKRTTRRSLGRVRSTLRTRRRARRRGRRRTAIGGSRRSRVGLSTCRTSEIPANFRRSGRERLCRSGTTRAGLSWRKPLRRLPRGAARWAPNNGKRASQKRLDAFYIGHAS